MRKLIAVLLLTIVATVGFANDNATKVSKLDGLSIKVIPAFFWNTYGLQAEYPLSFKVTLGMNAYYYTGLPKDGGDEKPVHQAFHNNNFGVDVFGKYYFKDNAPEGLYAYANVSYNKMLYFDGNNRPFALHNNWKDFDGFDKNNVLAIPSNLSGGVGVGYQIKFMPHLVGDATFVTQIQTSSDGGAYFSLHILPSVGYLF